jgi:hypothetical protein
MILSKAAMLVKIPTNAWGSELPPVHVSFLGSGCMHYHCIIQRRIEGCPDLAYPV